MVSRTNGFAVPALAGAVLFATLDAAAADLGSGTTDSVDWFMLAMGLFGGLALFLFGMEQMGAALRAVAGNRMKTVLAALSSNRFVGLLTGTGVTAIIQSSSVTTVMLVGFASADLMSLRQSLGVILGAGIGTTVTAQIVAFKVTKVSLALVAGGFFAWFAAPWDAARRWGQVVMGLGLIFFGMSVMSDAMQPLRGFQPFIDVMASMSNPVLGILAGAVFTGLIQSSSATMGVVIVLASQGLISLEAGIALALGANIGTCATAGLAAIGKPREAVRVAVAHVLFKVVGVVVILPFILDFAELARLVSPAGVPGLEGTDLLAAVVPRQVANAHTLFNVGIALAFLPFTGPFARLVEFVVRAKPVVIDPRVVPRHLDGLLLKTPGMALAAARAEIARLGGLVGDLLDRSLPVALHGSEAELDAVRHGDDAVDTLYGHIVTYLGEISRKSLRDQFTDELMSLMSAVNDLENIGDIVETDIVGLGVRRHREGVVVSPQTEERLAALHAEVTKNLAAAVKALKESDHEAAARVTEAKGRVNELVVQAERHQAQRLVADEPGRLAAYSLEIDLVDKLRRVYYHCKRVSKAVAGELAVKG